MSTTVVKAENLGKTYGDFRALKGITFHINAGECFGFLGHNGAGKTTTMRMMYGMSTIEEGRLWLFGESFRLTPPALKARLGVVPQEDNLDDDLNVMENLEVYGIIFGLTRAQARIRGQELLTFMGLEDKAHSTIESLSGGLKRRLVIARALMNHPELVILDEPTTGLDPQARHLVWQKLRSLKADGVTLILTTHYMEEAVQLCDNLVIMHQGVILAEGSPQCLIEKFVRAYAIEVHLPLAQVPAGLADKVISWGGEVIQVLDGLFFYADDGEALWNSLDGWGVPRHLCLLRPANLEDVFLKLTGMGEEE
ncbi:ABC transporter ATP-binding protein [Sporomusa acidovorans]|uniref:Linearmycin resistance ATP-binding protein LnrL n=1 Tax=Sporomusa acidovorans (strain ATCC 49682 / DSM 3132 / Mol) TaxID=1123286 RepID=A0ABZ3JA30_SPOA4|nr:ATP-binding cassette domain-containing protein [Sporomusa acidovorans]OZC21651.1 daunorubicin/doxorubicin resistance ATP-binding protein DrrA [Sporomusa acidovorans DSM 3132]SDD61046.1 lipooligosaccharide transport system ATP-binding protein [Sporomusa acidovorans]